MQIIAYVGFDVQRKHIEWMIHIYKYTIFTIK